MVDPRDDPIELAPSQHEQWRERFRAERERVASVLDDRGIHLERIEHVGSTAVPALPAKDVVDLDVVVPRDAVPEAAGVLAADLGGTRRSNHDGWHPVFRRHDGQRFNDHVFAADADGWRVSVVTRDVLRTVPRLRAEYDRHKRRLAAEHDDLTGYSLGKTDLMERLVRVAHEDDRFDYDFGIPAPEDVGP